MSADFVTTIRSTLSANNDERNAAEKQYDNALREQPAALIAGLFEIAAQRDALAGEQALREQSIILLRKCLNKPSSEEKQSEWSWPRLGADGQRDVKAKLLELLQAEPMKPVRRKIADAVQSLGNTIIELKENARPSNAEEWPELLPTLMSMIVDTSKDSGLRGDCLWAVKEMTVNVWPILLAGSEQTVQVLGGTLKDAKEEVAGNACALLCELVDEIKKKSDRKPFVPLIPEVSRVLSQLANSSDSKPLEQVLTSFQATTETADFFKEHIGSHIMPVLSEIAKKHPDDDIRKLAIEAIICLVEAKPKTILQVPNFLEQALEVCVAFIMELDDDVDSWMKADDEEEDDDEDLHQVGKQDLDRICRASQRVEIFAPVLEVLKPAITKLFQSGDWKQVTTAITILNQIAEYIDDEDTVKQMVGAIKVQLKASHPRVRYQAWGAIAQFSEDHSRVITAENAVQELMPEVITAMDDACERVQLRCMEAFQHYGENIEREDLEPFVSPVMEKLGVKLQSNKPALRKKSITFIAVVAGQIEDGFAPYYGPLMPILKQVISDTLHKVEERTLLGKCFECISLLAKAVGRAGFRTDAEHIMQAMIAATKVPNLPNNDPVKEYMLAASERICATMKEDFLPFIPHILPGVLEKFKFSPKEFNSDMGGEFQEGDEINLSVVEENGKVKILVISTSETEDLKNALSCVHTFVEELSKAYAPFVQQTALALLPVFEFNMDEEIRDLSFETWGQLCESARKSDQMQIVGELVQQFLKCVLSKLEQDCNDLMAQKTRADGITTCLKKAGSGVVTQEQVKYIIEVSKKVLEDSFRRREEIKKEQQTKREPGDDEEEEDGDALEEDEALRIAVCEIAGAIMEHHPDMFVQLGLSDYLQMVQKFIVPGAPQEDRKLAMFVVCDFLQHLGPRVTQHWEQFMPAMLQDVQHSATDIRQPACYGISLAAKQAAFAPIAQDAATKLSEVVTKSRALPKKTSSRPHQACADNALTAILNILLTHKAVVAQGEAALWEIWVNGLPCQEDEEEAKKNHKELLRLIREEKPEVIGAGGASFPRLLAVLVDVYKTDKVDEETSTGIGQLVQACGTGKLEQYAGSLSQKQVKKLQRIFREAQTAQGSPEKGFNFAPQAR
mmetsp:Transcript_70822/g.122647  ORF Transcript_70822/g.122647 Transcript_70822/m.122647 type:complete len:1132 (-) Transcript_70822:180-3575(-)